MCATLSRGTRPLFAMIAAAWLLQGGGALAAEGRIVIETVSDRQVITYLPPSYETALERRYPVIYLLHGGGSSPRAFIAGNYSGLNIKTTMDNLISLNVVREMIIVMPDINGVYREFILNDLIWYVDSHYRTLARRESRGVAGHSRGGFGSFVLATDHPEVFGAMYGLSASSLDREDAIVEGAPEKGMRAPLIARIGALRHLLKDLAIQFDVGTADGLLKANESMAAALTAAGIDHVFESYAGDHNGVIRQRLSTRLLPFFSKELAAQ